MSVREKLLNKERKLTWFDWFRKTKGTLKLRCADHGLSAMGKKAELVDYFSPLCIPQGHCQRITIEQRTVILL